MNHVTKVAVVVAAICALSVSAAAPKWHELSMQYTYDDYLRDFDKMQLRKRDYAARKRTFEAELQFVVQHNADPTATFKRNVNKFSDWTRSELQHLRMHSDFEGAIGSRAEAAISPTRRQASRTGFDWRSVTPPVMTTVKDQGGCGSCWAHATTEAVESQVAINTGKLFAFSQQQLVSCVPFVAAHFLNRTVIEGGCGGYMPNLAIDAIVGAPFNGGFAEEWENPYRDYWTGLAPYDSLPNMTTNAKCDGWMSAIPRPLGVVTGYDWVKSNDAEAFEDALINKGPIVVIMAVFSDLYSYDSGLYSSPQCEGKNGTLPPSHAVNLVGFGHDEGAKADYWIIRNSWSAAWGEAGYARLLRRPRDACTTMFLPQSNFSNLTNWAPLPACGMCGLLAFGLVPRT